MRIFYLTHRTGQFADRRGIAFDADDDSKLTQDSSLDELTAGAKLAGPWFKCDDCDFCFCEWDRRPIDRMNSDFRAGLQTMFLNDKGTQVCFQCCMKRRREIKNAVKPQPKPANRPQPMQMPSRIVPQPVKHPIKADDAMKTFLAANGQKSNAEKFGGTPA